MARSAAVGEPGGNPAAASLLRLVGLLLLLLLVAPLSTIHRSIQLWSERQRDIANGALSNDDAVRAAAAASAAAQAKQRQSGAAGESPGVTNIGRFVIHGNNNNRNGRGGDESKSIHELLSTIFGMGFAGRRRGFGGVGVGIGVGGGGAGLLDMMYQNDYLYGMGMGGGGIVAANEFAMGVQVILPWILALVLGVVVPAILTVISLLRSSRFRDYYKGLDRKEKRLFRLILCLKRFKKTIEEDDLIRASDVGNTSDEESETNAGSDENHCANVLLSMPPPGEPLLTKDELDDDDAVIPHRRAPASCAICLEPYEVGDVIVWASNQNCRDVFHEQCIVSWLTKKRNARCPCCRQQFIDQVLRSQAGFR